MKILSCFVAAALAYGAITSIVGQQPNPVILQATTPAPVAASSTPVAAAAAETQNTLTLLQEMQATNAATIQKQEAALETLDALQKSAEEIKIYSKRG